MDSARVDSSAPQPPRLRDNRHVLDDLFILNLRSESEFMLRVDDADMVLVPDVFAKVDVILDARFSQIIELSNRTPAALAARGLSSIPDIPCTVKGHKIFTPSIPKFIDAYCNQLRTHRLRGENRRPGGPIRLPRAHEQLGYLVSYLYLERPSQQEILLPLLAEQNRDIFQKRARHFKRKPTIAMLKEQWAREGSRPPLNGKS
ncbi:MAG: hypothetical protein Q9218_005940 [Villophora microphyllina]